MAETTTEPTIDLDLYGDWIVRDRNGCSVLLTTADLARLLVEVLGGEEAASDWFKAIILPPGTMGPVQSRTAADRVVAALSSTSGEGATNG